MQSHYVISAKTGGSKDPTAALYSQIQRQLGTMNQTIVVNTPHFSVNNTFITPPRDAATAVFPRRREYGKADEAETKREKTPSRRAQLAAVYIQEGRRPRSQMRPNQTDEHSQLQTIRAESKFRIRKHTPMMKQRLIDYKPGNNNTLPSLSPREQNLSRKMSPLPREGTPRRAKGEHFLGKFAHQEAVLVRDLAKDINHLESVPNMVNDEEALGHNFSFNNIRKGRTMIDEMMDSSLITYLNESFVTTSNKEPAESIGGNKIVGRTGAGRVKLLAKEFSTIAPCEFDFTLEEVVKGNNRYRTPPVERPEEKEKEKPPKAVKAPPIVVKPQVQPQGNAPPKVDPGVYRRRRSSHRTEMDPNTNGDRKAAKEEEVNVVLPGFPVF
eukprot:TRINITY_DN1310_c0_g1_i2.p1 TRINITY_DN1310_c0_g1~~TRINITY_DN1310_c0_g1_i2.p1  ORF type:complete len:383 (-),score=74.85 TRINITY_DN1310_c0_g1_i2:37-1185(-)